MKPLLRLAAAALLVCLAPMALLIGCQSNLIYYPRPYPPGTITAWDKAPNRTSIPFTTSQGAQRAFLQGKLNSPRNLWIVCGGNGSVALDWSAWLAEHAPQQDAFLLVDFPGYGSCEGAPTPGRIAESFQTVLPIATKKLGMPNAIDGSRLRFFGHSLGGAAVMIAASQHSIQRGVLLAPFTSTMDMAKEMTGIPIGFLVTHRFDNLARLADLNSRGPGHVIILHGTEDRVIPFDMAVRLAASQPNTAELITLEGAGHNNTTQTHTPRLAEALHMTGQ